MHLGVKDIPYEDGGPTTGEVAQWLENRYSIMEFFFMVHENQIAEMMARDMASQLESIMAGAPVSQNLMAESMSEIMNMFIQFIGDEEMNGIWGIPTKRAMKGIRKRLKKMKGPPRPSFMDTGNYTQSFTAWVDGYLNDFT